MLQSPIFNTTFHQDKYPPIKQEGLLFFNRDNQYIMVRHDYDMNTILVEPMKNKTTNKIIEKYTLLHDCLCRAGIKPRYQKLDNEAPEAFKKCIQNTSIYYQLVSPHIH